MAAKKVICTFEPLDYSSHSWRVLPYGRLVLRPNGDYKFKQRLGKIGRVTIIKADAPFDGEAVREWLEWWEFGRVCATHLGSTKGAPHYKISTSADSAEHLNSIRQQTERQLALPKANVDGSLTIQRSETAVRILSEPPGPELITSLVLGSSMYRYIFYTPDSRTVQQGAMAPELVIPEEVHTDVEQYFLVKAGHGWCIIDGKPSELSTTSAVWVYRGQSHAVVSDPTNPLKLFTSYSPAHHPAGRINQNNVDVLEPK